MIFNTEFDTDFIYAFKKYMLKSLSDNTANHYLKMLKGVISKASKENIYHYQLNPFIPVTFKHVVVRKQALNDKELQNLIKCKLVDGRLNRIKTAFLAQIFTQGIRVSDLFLLRWGNYKSGYINYKIFKTNRNINVYVSENL